MQEVLRLKKASTNILSAYHDDPNIAISLMNSAFEKCKKDHQEQIAVTEALQKAFKSIEPVTKGNIQTLVPKREFIPASQVKTFGKIEPSEQLEEPIGRQGRDVK